MTFAKSHICQIATIYRKLSIIRLIYISFAAFNTSLCSSARSSCSLSVSSSSSIGISLGFTMCQVFYVLPSSILYIFWLCYLLCLLSQSALFSYSLSILRIPSRFLSLGTAYSTISFLLDLNLVSQIVNLLYILLPRSPPSPILRTFLSLSANVLNRFKIPPSLVCFHSPLAIAAGLPQLLISFFDKLLAFLDQLPSHCSTLVLLGSCHLHSQMRIYKYRFCFWNENMTLEKASWFDEFMKNLLLIHQLQMYLTSCFAQ